MKLCRIVCNHSVNFYISLCIYELLLFDDKQRVKHTKFIAVSETADFSQKHFWIKVHRLHYVPKYM